MYFIPVYTTSSIPGEIRLSHCHVSVRLRKFCQSITSTHLSPKKPTCKKRAFLPPPPSSTSIDRFCRYAMHFRTALVWRFDFFFAKRSKCFFFIFLFYREVVSRRVWARFLRILRFAGENFYHDNEKMLESNLFSFSSVYFWRNSSIRRKLKRMSGKESIEMRVNVCAVCAINSK